MRRALIMTCLSRADVDLRNSLNSSCTDNLVVAGLAERVAQPFKTLIQTVTGCSASRLDVPSTLSETVEAKLVSDFGGVHGVGQILLVGKDKEESVSQLVLVQHSLELLACLDNTIAIIAVNDENDALGILEVMPPEWSDLVLTADVPYGELNVLVLDGFDVEANGGDGCNDFAQLELIQNGRLSGGVQANHQDAHLLLSP